MNWVAIDIGSSEVKASVLDIRNTPVRLNYPMGGYYTTRLSTEVVITDSGEIVVGDNARLLGVMSPGLLFPDWQHHSCRESIYKALLSFVYNAAREHYADNVIGAVVLYESVQDECLVKVCEQIFAEIKPMKSSTVFAKSTPGIKSGVTVVADFGAQSFKVSILEDGEQKLFMHNPDLGFRALDLDSLIDSVQWNNLTDVESSLYGLLIQKAKVALNRGNHFILPYETKLKGDAINNEYERCMTTYLYQCFEECSNSLHVCFKTWEDVTNILFVGGGANSNIIDSVFERYLQGKGYSLKSYNSTNKQFDTQYAATNCAIQMPIISDNVITIKYR